MTRQEGRLFNSELDRKKYFPNISDKFYVKADLGKISNQDLIT